jgi:hypothetical protein
MEAYLANIKAKTGKDPEDFRKIAEEKGLLTAKHKEVIDWLKADFELGHGHANLIAHMILHADEPRDSDEEGIAKHFEKGNAVWRKPYHELIAKLQKFGSDVRVAPTKTYLSLLRGEKKFGIVQVSSKRLDIGIKLSGLPFEGRFEESGKWNAMVTHRVKIDEPIQIDDEILKVLRQAYDKA